MAKKHVEEVDELQNSLSEKEFIKRYREKVSKGGYKSSFVTVDVVLCTIRQGKLSILLIQRGQHPFKGSWAIPGGFFDPDKENPLEAAWRELEEETGVSQLSEGIHLEQLATFARPGRDPRGPVVSIAYLAFAPNLPMPTHGSDAAQAKFWAVEDLFGKEAPPLAFDHADIIRTGLERTRAKLEYTTLATSFVEEPFTLADLKRVYEAVWDVKIADLSNFRRKVLGSEGFVIPVGDVASRPKGSAGGRPAELYTRGNALDIQPPMLRKQMESNDKEL
jgi:8-oxo-dGTP diphosphatase